ncbi:endopeptidase La [Pontibacter sp. G13]|uniref:endopeptidase La n=1 Tax=Pontibacter sp. G13 TaxID=3074898 RepID=UPI00288BD7CF|nr:endopeptidase La [Pontibacter sp. G13]WNJ20277.1 endopeptidase La [Pontibacter sp. G13]
MPDIPSTTPENGLQLQEAAFPPQLLIHRTTDRPVFPGVPFPLVLTDAPLIHLVQRSVEEFDGYLGVVYQPEGFLDDQNLIPKPPAHIGTLVRIFRHDVLADDMMQVLVQGLHRFQFEKELMHEPNLIWSVQYPPSGLGEKAIDQELKALTMAIGNQVKELIALNPVLQEQVRMMSPQLTYEKPGLMMDIVAGILPASSDETQELLETFNLKLRANKLIKLLNQEIQVAQLQQDIKQQIEQEMSKREKEFFLREQLKAIRKELGMEKEPQQVESEKLTAQIENKTLTEEAQKEWDDNLEQLNSMDPRSPEYNTIRNWLDIMSELPWGIFSEDQHDIQRAAQILEESHYGLDEVKDLILEFLSTLIKRGHLAGSIICLVGPPGVGKTSIGKSIADALGRKFYRFSLGGMKDEAEIKGHRRTYVGALPGKFITAIRRAGTSNPVIMLDELDKLGASYQGDPASALLEVLDPEQNHAFRDHYLDVAYDLSKVLFVATANQLDTIPRPLLDRMEIISLPGYLVQEKVEIARQFLVPKQLEEAGYQPDEIVFTEGALSKIVDQYAREAGVRNLEKQIRKVIRKITLQAARGGETVNTVDEDAVVKFLGNPVFVAETLYDEGIPGVALGLAYTALGGATLYIEANGIRAKQGFKLTGKLGEVMQESAQIAYTYVQTILMQGETPEINDYFEHHFVHVHVPAGATPKDGPSAGITIATALYSLASHTPVKPHLGMTGELTLTGKVLPIGGVREKTLAARRVGLTKLLLPKDNQRDFDELPDHLKEGLQVHFVDTFHDVLQHALDLKPPTGGRMAPRGAVR